MRRLFWFLLILVLSVWMGLKIAEDPGYALFAYKQWSIEMPLWFLAVGFVLVVLVFYFILRFFDSIDFSIYRLKNWLQYRRKYKSYSKTNRGLIELIEGRWRSAEHYLLEGVQQSDAPLINYLAAAKAAQEQKAYDRRELYLQKAHQVAPHAEMAIGLTQSQLQFEQDKLEQSLATLDHLHTIAPKQPLVLKLLEKVYVRLADWNALLKLLPSLRKAKIIKENDVEKFEKNIYLELLRTAINKHEGLHVIQRVWEAIPKKFQKDPELIFYYVSALKLYPATGNEIEELVNKAVKKSWNKELVRLYGLIVVADPKKQLAHAESWQRQHGQQAILLLTLGRLCMRCQLWGKARSYFEESLKLEAYPETYAEYGKLLEHLNEKNIALQSYRDGLLLASKLQNEI